jgi:hypothetical protein
MTPARATGDSRKLESGTAQRRKPHIGRDEPVIVRRIDAELEAEIAQSARAGDRAVFRRHIDAEEFDRLLVDEAIGGPHALRIAIRGIDEFDVVPDYAHHAKMRIYRSRYALVAFEKLLHTLMLAGSRVLIR